MKLGTTLLLLFGLFNLAFGQNTYEKVYESTDHFQSFNYYPTKDGGLLSAGLISGDVNSLFLMKTNCKGEVVWNKSYFPSSTIDNIRFALKELPNGDIVFAGNVGKYQNYDIMLYKLDANGEVIWQYLNNGFKDDKVMDLEVDVDGNIYLVGSTGTFGTETNFSVIYSDAYIMKVSPDGELLWTKTLGNEESIDAAWALCGNHNGGVAVTGRFLNQGAFQVMFLTMGTDGTINSFKTYGDTLHRNYGLDIIETSDQNFLITGLTTLSKDNFSDYPDAFLMKVNPAGEMLWSKTYIPTNNDKSDSGSKIIENKNGYVISMPTLSYYTPGAIVQNKSVLIFTDFDGNMTKALSYIPQEAHYASVFQSNVEQAVYLCSFSTLHTPFFSPQIIKLNSDFEGACETVELTGQTNVGEPEFKDLPVSYVEDSGDAWVDGNVSMNSFFAIPTTLCENITEDCVLTNKNIQTEALKVNPTLVDYSTIVELPKNSNGGGKLSIIDMEGHMVSFKTVKEGQRIIEVNTSDLPTGLYLIRWLGNETIYQTKIVVAH